VTPPLLPEPPDAADAEALFATADIVLDSNVVLNLYRMSRGTRDAWLDVLWRLREQLVMPYQVAVEVTRNVSAVRSSLPNSYDALHRQVDGLRRAPAAHFTGSRHLHAERIATLKAMLDVHLDRALSELQEIRGDDEAVVDADRDSVMAALDELFADRVLPEPAAATIRRRVERFRDHRAPNEVPPGWKDARPGEKSTPLLAAGDYLLWAEVLDHARESHRRFIIVTDDAKADWWHKEHGKVAPATAMVAEAVRTTGHAYAQLNSESFLELAQRLLALTENETAVKETAEIGSARDMLDPDQLLLVERYALLSELDPSSREAEILRKELRSQLYALDEKLGVLEWLERSTDMSADEWYSMGSTPLETELLRVLADDRRRRGLADEARLRNLKALRRMRST
jgi:hypothetical protein